MDEQAAPPGRKQLKQRCEYLLAREKELELELKSVRAEWHTTIKEIRSMCNHKLANGESAWEHHYAYSSCSICGESDL